MSLGALTIVSGIIVLVHLILGSNTTEVHPDVFREDLHCDPTTFGAKGDGVSDNTLAIQNAIAVCSANSRGHRFTLFFPAGVFLTGSFRLVSNMTMKLSQGSIITASTEANAYPLIPPFPSFGVARDTVKNLSMQHAALICGYNVSGVIIEGSGKDNISDGIIDGQGKSWWAKLHSKQLEYTRPRLIEFMFSKELILRNLRIRDPPFWNTHFYASRDIIVERLNMTAPFLAPNADGLDLDSVINVTVKDCDIGVGDDAIAIKSGLNQAGVDFAHPSMQIHIQNVRAYSKCISIGSEMSGCVHDVLWKMLYLGIGGLKTIGMVFL